MKMNKKTLGNFALITQLGFTLTVTVFLSIFIGIWLDKVLETGYIFTILFIIIGIGAAFRNLYIIAMTGTSKNEKGLGLDDDRKEDN